jgi:hypothetical protein
MGAKPNNAERKARTRAPAPVILRLRQDLAPNDSHPLFGINPERRNADRQQLIASILARLASGQSSDSGKVDTMAEAAVTEQKSGE